MRILLVSYYCPTRAHAGGLRVLDMYRLIKKMCPSVQIDIMTHQRPAIDWSIDDIYHVFNNIYFTPTDDLSSDVFENLAGHSISRYDVVDIQFHEAGYYISSYRKIASKVLFTPMESQAKAFYLELRNQITRSGKFSFQRLVRLFKMTCEEICFSRKADEVVCVSETDASFIRSVGGGAHVHGIETGLSPLEFFAALTDSFLPLKASERSKTIIYVAYFGSETNVHALRWYLETVHPIVVDAVPDYKLIVVGRGDLSPFCSYQGTNIELVGEVPTLEFYIRKARLGIAPVLGGSGFRGKINQYAILGIPTVTTSMALKGLAYRDGINISVSNSSEGFAGACIRLLIDDLWNDTLGAEARKLCLERYTWMSKWKQIEQAYSLRELGQC